MRSIISDGQVTLWILRKFCSITRYHFYTCVDDWKFLLSCDILLLGLMCNFLSILSSQSSKNSEHNRLQWLKSFCAAFPCKFSSRRETYSPAFSCQQVVPSWFLCVFSVQAKTVRCAAPSGGENLNTRFDINPPVKRLPLELVITESDEHCCCTTK